MKKIKAISALSAILLAGALILPVAHFGAAADCERLQPSDGAFAALSAVVSAERAGEYRLERTLEVGYGTVYRFRQTANGQDVFGGEITVSVDRAGNLLSANGEYIDLADLPAASYGESLARARAEEAFGAVSAPQKTVFAAGPNPEPAYEYTDAEGGRIFVSAVDGEILLSAPASSPYAAKTTQTNALGEEVEIEVEYLETRDTYQLADLTRNIFVYNAKNMTGLGQLITEKSGEFEPMAVSVFQSIVKAYDFYTDEANIGTQIFGINNGNDAIAGNADTRAEEIPIIAVVHYGNEYENAAFYYDSNSGRGYMYVGDGAPNGKIYLPGRAVDVIAHEYQHGVTTFAADLVYLNESGALNEAFSDIFGALVEGYDLSEENFWNIGELSVPAGRAALRSMKNPTGSQRVTVANMAPACNRSGNHNNHGCDNGGVHYNSTIVSHLQYLMWEKQPAFFTREAIGKLWYATLCALKENSDFDDFARVFLQTAVNLDYPDEVRTAMHESLYESGILVQDTADDFHTVIYRNQDGTVLQQSVVRHGSSVLPPADPTIPSTAQYDYRFTGWDKVITTVTEDVTVTARFTPVLREYTVTFLDYDGNILKTQSVRYGSAAEAPAPTAKPENAEFRYEFEGWDVDFSSITGDLTVTAQYRGIVRSYTVVYYSNGTELDRKTVAYGMEIPLFETQKFCYKFAGWYLDKDFSESAEGKVISGDTTLYAKWESDPVPISLITVGSGVAAAGVAAGTVVIVRKKRKK